jgi:predicted NBD/HSP70 family sugar kinase
MTTEYHEQHWFEGSDYTHRVAQAVAQYGPIARTTLAQMLGLSQGALSRITSDLIYDNVIEEMPADADTSNLGNKLPMGFTPKESTNRRGRPQTALQICANNRTFVGVNIHGTDVSVITVDALCNPITECATEPLHSTEPEAVVEQIRDLVTANVQGVQPAPVLLGLGMGGHPQNSRQITYAPFLHWDGTVELAAMLEDSCGIPSLIFNDLDALLQYESWFGAGVGLPRFALLTIGVGIGYALSEDGKPIDYPDKSYGLASHVLVDPEGPRCFAGHIGCAQCLTSDSIAEEYSLSIGSACSFEQFAEDATAGKAQARPLVNKLCFRLGALISAMANFTMPTKVLISGESSFLAKLNTESIRSGINTYRPSQASKVDFDILDFSWTRWAQAAASHAIANYLE